MKRALTILAGLIIALSAETHPLHLSVTNISCEEGHLQVVLKTFRNDWETAYFHYHGEVADLSDPEGSRNPWFDRYLEDCFRISAVKDGTPVQLELGSFRLDQESLTIEMEAEWPGTSDSLYIYNALLIDIFPDQKNLVIIGCQNGETGIEFDVFRRDHSVSLK